MTGGPDRVASIVCPHPLSPSVDRVAPGKAGLPAQSARQPLREEPQHGALCHHAVPGHGNYLCVTIATWPGVPLCDPAGPLPGASRTGRASSLPCSRYPITQLLPSLWLSLGATRGSRPVREGADGGQTAPQPRGPERAGRGSESLTRARPDKHTLTCAHAHHASATLKMHDFYFYVLISLTLQSVACHNLIAVFFSFLETHKIMVHLKTDEALELTKHSIYTLAIDFSGLISIHLFMTNPNSFTETECGDPYHLTLCVPLCPRRARTLLYVPVRPSVQCSVGHWRHREVQTGRKQNTPSLPPGAHGL